MSKLLFWSKWSGSWQASYQSHLFEIYNRVGGKENAVVLHIEYPRVDSVRDAKKLAEKFVRMLDNA